MVANARLNMPLVATVSMRALIGFGRCFWKSFAQLGTKPQLIWGEFAMPVPLPDRVHGVGRRDVPARREAGVDLARVLVDVLGARGKFADEFGEQVSGGVGDDEAATHATSVHGAADVGTGSAWSA
ncbi:hypothetical protein [Curtobacterium sp. MCPF17_052]|uniref:hypothetical protein n=1 Tax=Curtobacterium sp. MCPF17_052 TaxID=2175655 RepID=UPI0024DF61CC|nr:hypothetical protein [Curtobacterium sp. MCPF17_052]WIB14064.1 hypothetical protein DEJ36_13250 [Curtobacterium sp. MCPF17_052]